MAGEKQNSTRPYHQIVDQGHGSMESENRAANQRFQHNSKVMQQAQVARATPRTEQPQVTKPELTFAPDRQQGQTHGQLKPEQANPVAKDQDQQQVAKKELSFGSDRKPHRPNYNLLKVEQAKAAGNGQGQQQGEKKALTFGPGREGGQGQDHSRGR